MVYYRSNENCSRAIVLVKAARRLNRSVLSAATDDTGDAERGYTVPMSRKRSIADDGTRPPAEAHDTVRHAIITELEEGPLSARDLSGRVGISEKEVAAHLEHIRASLHRNGRYLEVQPAECAKCGFVFEKRGRLTRPGKCPVCRSESIHAPLFSLAVP